MDWNDVRYFLALARCGSVRAAGASLRVSHSTVARRLESLEVRLATRLFDRHREGLSLTDAGRKMLDCAERVEREVCSLERCLAGEDERLAGVVRLTCCDEFVSEMVVHELSMFCASYPEIELQVTASSQRLDLAKREADLAIRTLGVGDSPPPHLIGAKVAPVVIANYVAAEHRHRLDPDCPGTTPRWISFEDRKLAEAFAASSSYPEVPLWGGFSSLGLMLQAAQSGFGIASLPCYVADRNPSLQRLRSPDLRHVADLWLVSHPDLRENARFRAARACVRQALEGHRRLFEGAPPPSAGGDGKS